MDSWQGTEKELAATRQAEIAPATAKPEATLSRLREWLAPAPVVNSLIAVAPIALLAVLYLAVVGDRPQREMQRFAPAPSPRDVAEDSSGQSLRVAMASPNVNSRPPVSALDSSFPAVDGAALQPAPLMASDETGIAADSAEGGSAEEPTVRQADVALVGRDVAEDRLSGVGPDGRVEPSGSPAELPVDPGIVWGDPLAQPPTAEAGTEGSTAEHQGAAVASPAESAPTTEAAVPEAPQTSAEILPLGEPSVPPETPDELRAPIAPPEYPQTHPATFRYPQHYHLRLESLVAGPDLPAPATQAGENARDGWLSGTARLQPLIEPPPTR